MRLDTLLTGIEYHLQQGNPDDCKITGLCEDSRKIKRGELFFCRTGAHTSGKKYLRQALFGVLPQLSVMHMMRRSDVYCLITKQSVQSKYRIHRNRHRCVWHPIFMIFRRKSFC